VSGDPGWGFKSPLAHVSPHLQLTGGTAATALSCEATARPRGLGGWRGVRRYRSGLVAALVLLATTLLPATPAPAAAGSPSLRLRSPQTSVDLYRTAGRRVRLELPVFLASLDAPFDLRVRRESYDDPLGLWQAVHAPSGVELHELPAELLDGWDGLDAFLRVRVYALDGRLLRNKEATICPAGWEVQRLDDSGPFEPTYPSGCYAHPFSLGTVWGVDQGWAVRTVWMTRPAVELRDGTYRAVVTITKRYRDAFAIPPADARVEVQIRIRTFTGCEFCGRPAAPERRDDRSALTRAPIVTDPDPATIPDLVALPAYGIQVSVEGGRDRLNFGANVWDRGPASLVVEGFRVDGEDLMDAYQYFFDGDEIVGRASVGSFAFDRRDGHQHWHFLQFARYRLLDATLSGVVRSRKQSFCLAPTDALDLTVENAVWRPDDLGFSQCGWEDALWIREVLPTGWGDTYFQGVPGQSFDITDLPNGTYWIEVRANPLGSLYDNDPTNDTSLREVILGGSPGARTVTVPPWHGIDTG
jgi:lysyl oxidase